LVNFALFFYCFHIWFLGFYATISKSFILARSEGLEPVLYMLACSKLILMAYG